MSREFSRCRAKAPPGSQLAAARVAAHHAFDPIWQSGLLTRKEAYRWLSNQLGIPFRFCHMQMFPVATCTEVIALCRPIQRAIEADEWKALTA